MLRLTLILVAAIFSANTESALAECNFDSCTLSNPKNAAECKSAFDEQLKCLNDVKDGCPESERAGVNTKIAQAELAKTACDGAEIDVTSGSQGPTNTGDASRDECKFTSCARIGASCSAYTKYLTCLTEASKQKACSDGKAQIDQVIAENQKKKEELKCDGAEIDVTSGSQGPTNTGDASRDECKFTSCARIGASCSAYTKYLTCLTEASKQKACSDGKAQIDQVIAENQKKKEELKCGVQGLVSSITLSLGLCILSIFLSTFK